MEAQETGKRTASVRARWRETRAPERRLPIDGLSASERLVLYLRFGAYPRPRSRAQVAAFLRLPCAQVERMERRALRALRCSALGPISGGWDGWDEV